MACAVRNSLSFAAFALAGSLAFAAAHAADAAASDAPGGARPARGDRMSAVEQHYGQPAERYPAVGTPAITRWDYPTMVVFFENDRVIHAVLVSPAS